MAMFRRSIMMLLSCFRNPEIIKELKQIDALVASDRAFDALKAIRALYPVEERILSNEEVGPAAIAGLRREMASWQ